MKIRDVNSSLKDAYIDWSHFLINPRYVQREQKDEDDNVSYQEITWDRRNPDYRITEPVSEATIIDCVNASQYTYQVKEDGSIFQIYYRFDRHGEELINASLGFYLANSHKRMIDEEALLDEIAVLPPEEQDSMLGAVIGSIDNQSVGWIRIDYDPTAKERGIVHHDCHMHLSNFPHTRFIVSGVPTPRQFIEFVISAVYPEVYKAHCLELKTEEETEKGIWQYRDANRIKKVNELCMPLESDPVYNQLSHLRIPSDN